MTPQANDAKQVTALASKKIGTFGKKIVTFQKKCGSILCNNQMNFQRKSCRFPEKQPSPALAEMGY